MADLVIANPAGALRSSIPLRVATFGPWILALAACATSPDIEHPALDVAVPETWTANSNALDDTDSIPVEPWLASFWRELGDPELDRVIARALERNHDLRAASERILGAAAEARIAGADSLPQVNAAFDAGRSQRNFIGLPIPGSNGVLSTRSTSTGLALGLSWELDVWGRIRAGQSAALASLEAVAADAAAARLSLIGQTAKLWFALIEVRRQVALSESTLANFRATHETIRSRYERGLRPPTDVRLSLSSIATAEALLAAYREVEDRLLRELDVLLGDYPDARRGISSTELPAPSAEPPRILPADVVRRRPDLAAAERRLAAAGLRVREAWRSLLPRISLSASGGTSSDDIGDLLDASFGVWSIAGNAAQPIIQGGRLLARIDATESAERELVLRYSRTALAAFREVETALAANGHLSSREAALAVAAREATAARELAEDRYARGLEDVLTLLDAQRRAFESESQRLGARRERIENRIDLYLALGGDAIELGAVSAATRDSSGDATAP
jgi:multidrug efflux system outer membrane protein